jgi:phage baseplate assembly protein W
MSILVQKINPLDLESRKAIGISLPFSGIAIFNSTYETKDAIKYNLLNFLLTGKKERYFNINFGSSLRNQLFENINNTTLQNIKNEIIEDLKIYFSKVIVKNLEIQTNPDSNIVTLYLKYDIQNSNSINQELTINIEQ